MPRSRALLILFLVTLLALPGGPGPRAASAQTAYSEYKVKAEFIERLAQFVDWPAGAFGGPEAPFVIEVVGEDPFGRHLEDLARTRTIKGRPVLIRRVQPGGLPGACHLLFIAAGEYGRLAGILASAAGRPVMTVGDGEKFAKGGAHVGLYSRAGRLRFEINLGAAGKSGLAVSSKLLRLAAAVYGGGDK